MSKTYNIKMYRYRSLISRRLDVRLSAGNKKLSEIFNYSMSIMNGNDKVWQWMDITVDEGLCKKLYMYKRSEYWDNNW